MASNKLAYLGLARKAGKTMLGSAACEKGIKNGRIRLLLMHSALSAGSKASFGRLCSRNEVRTVITDEPIGAAVGRADVMVIGVTDAGFASMIQKTVESVKGSGKHE